MTNTHTATLAVLLLAFAPVTLAEPKSDFHQDTTIRKIAFGSCNDPRKGDSPMFKAIVQHKPDLFLFLGDNIYGDTEDMELLKTKWEELGAIKDYQKLRENTPVLATWDDHDYGVNDGGNTYKMREESERVFLDFFGDAADSPRRERPGVHGAHTFGEPGKTVQILMLDTRYFRDVLPRTKSPKKETTVGWYEPTKDTSLTLLGECRQPIPRLRPSPSTGTRMRAITASDDLRPFPRLISAAGRGRFRRDVDFQTRLRRHPL